MPPALQILADDFAAHGYDLHRLIRVIAGTEAFRLDSAADGDERARQEKSLGRLPADAAAARTGGRQRPAGGVGHATIDAESHILFRLARFGQQNDFVTRYGDTGEDEFDGRAGTIPQRLLLMNGEIVREKIKEDPFNASTRIAWMAPDDPRRWRPPTSPS